MAECNFIDTNFNLHRQDLSKFYTFVEKREITYLKIANKINFLRYLNCVITFFEKRFFL